MSPGFRLFLASVGAVYALKALAVASRPSRGTAAGWAAFWMAWPGLIPSWCRRGPAAAIDAGRFFGAWARLLTGAVCIAGLAAFAPRIPEPVLGLAGIAALLLMVHLGIGDLLPWLLRWAGFPAPLLFDRPWAARSLADFWGRRWNLAFVEMNRVFFARPLCRRFGSRGARWALFALSGLFHEVAISFPAGGGWGLPGAYFLLQAALIEIEERFRITSRTWTWICVLAPAPWLFHEQFRGALVTPFYMWMYSLAANSWTWYLSTAIYLAAIGHCVVLAGGLQAPARLGWRDDFRKLTRFNRKIFWVYSAFIVLCIVGFGVLTWRLHDEFLQGERAARYLAGFIATFWTTRVLADLFWYDHRDWPPGNALIAGHAALTSLFVALASVYWIVALG